MGFLPLRYPGRLAQKLAAFIVLFSSVLALGITAAELSIEYQRDLRSIDSQMAQIEDAYLPSVVENVWVVDHERLGTLLLGITRLPNFSLAEIRVEGKTLLRRGQEVQGNGARRVLPLWREHRGQKLLIGELLVAASYEEVYQRTINRLVFFLGANVLKTFFVVLFVFSLFYRLIGRHIVQVARHAGQVAEDQSIGPLTLERKEPREGDEFSELVTALNHMRERLRQQQDSLLAQVKDLRTKDAAMASSLNAIAIADLDGTVTYINRACADLWRLAHEDDARGHPLREYWNDPVALSPVLQALQHHGRWQGELLARRADGSKADLQLAANMVLNEAGQPLCMMASFVDVTERKKAEKKINELAYFDPVTGLPNRTLLMDRLQQSMAASTRNDLYSALFFVDLDKFKTINDTLGRDMGDLLLKKVARRLSRLVREGDTVARLGGDEFVLILEGLNLEEGASAAAIETIAHKMLDALNQPYLLGEVTHHSSASLGITLFKGDLVNAEYLMKQAEIAMYKSKEAGRNAWGFFDPRMESAVKERAAMETDLRLALAQQQFVLFYQPQVNGKIRLTGAEALIRWLHPQRGMVSPAEFIPLAEDTGLILPIGQWVLEEACAQLARWAAQPGLAHLTIAVNVSARQFRQPSFVDQVMSAILQTGANPQRLKLELTESLLVQDVPQVIEKMSALKSRGVGFSLDDFGTGYSSLSYLKRLPLDQLKIDASFVRDILLDPNDASIAKTIVALAHSLDLNVIAEGVETEAQREFLASSGCHDCQGYLFSRPVPIADFEQFTLQT
ncbi:EAL domain-containing protein [Rhodoferax ferrireducens]|uniref:bifunctional diguanylate cyclase/phosphodiesterase n=1 Tax=Rhodoferax ferrireducens TaxID=192843 RepID=UPI000E0D29CE|nr:EAL domain-containing protein [Rhodoferax ferrireducens]